MCEHDQTEQITLNVFQSEGGNGASEVCMVKQKGVVGNM